MKIPPLTLLLSLACLIVATREARADSTLAGVFLSGQGQGLAAGKIVLTFKAAQVSFQATLFRQYATNGTLQAILEVEGKTVPMIFGKGEPGTWPIGDFLGPAPGTAPAPAPGPLPNLEKMPSLPPPNADGTRFTGRFTPFPGLEHLILAKGGKVNLQIHGIVASLQNPLFKATLVNVALPRTRPDYHEPEEKR